MPISESTTRGERGADTERPSDVTYARLRAAADGDLTPEARAIIREQLEDPLRDHIRSLCVALDALGGPDSETALIYMFDSVSTIRRALTALDARLSGSTLAVAATVAHLLAL
jgi:hypothetical protein